MNNDDNNNMKVTEIPIIICATGMIPKDLESGLEELDIGWQSKTIQKKPSSDWKEYWEESWRLEITCCHADFSERSSANASVENSQGIFITMMITTTKNKQQLQKQQHQ